MSSPSRSDFAPSSTRLEGHAEQHDLQGFNIPSVLQMPDPADLEDQQERSTSQTSTAQSRSRSTPHSQHSEKDPNLVTWDDSDVPDPDNPRNWTQQKRWLTLLVVSTCALDVTNNSSIVTATYDDIAKDFGISKEVAILGLSLFVTGLGSGPLFLGPFSEAYGRRPIYIISFLMFLLLQFPVAFANNAAVYFCFRFLAGLSGSAFLSVVGGTVVDCFDAYYAFPPMMLFVLSTFLGPVFGPLIGNFIVQNTTWRWAWYTTIIWTFVQYVLILFFAPETYAPKILTSRARRLRKQTGNQALYSEHERKIANMSFVQSLGATLTRVPKLLIYEPMLLALCVWCALLLGITYLLFEAYPIVFEDLHGWTESQTGLAFLGILVGAVIGGGSVIFWQRKYQRAADAHGGVAPPEERLPMSMSGAFATVVSLFIMAFTAYEHVSPWGFIIGSIPFGYGVIVIFCSCFMYTAGCWHVVAASAMACNSIVRSTWAAAFPLFATQMYNGLGCVGATALLAGVNVLMIPIPFILYRKGPALRAKSRFVP